MDSNFNTSEIGINYTTILEYILLQYNISYVDKYILIDINK